MQYNRTSIYNKYYSTEIQTTQVNLKKEMWQYLNAMHAIKVVSPHLLARFFLSAPKRKTTRVI